MFIAPAIGRYVAVTAVSEKSRRALFRHFGREELTELAGTADNQARAYLEHCFAQNDSGYWVAALSAIGVEIALVNTPTEAFDNPQLQAP